MTFPEGVNYRDFYKACKAKGVKIRSKYAGVYLGVHQDGSIYFFSCFKRNGKNITKTFPITPDGELQAYQQYLRDKNQK